jgi:Uma2 family endonuclease
MSASLKPLTVEELLKWERTQPHRYEFDGIQPVAMSGENVPHARIQTRLVVALGSRVTPPCEAFASLLKVPTPGRVRYPDATVACYAAEEDTNIIAPTAVFEVISPSTALTDRRVKPLEYAAVPGIMVYVILETDRPEVTVMRRAASWEPETIHGMDAIVPLPEIGIELPLAAIYRR